MANEGNLKRGENWGNKGGHGKPSDVWKKMCQEAVSRADRFAIAESVIDNPEHPAWLGAFKFLTEQGFGKAQQSLDHTTNGESMNISAKEAAARIAAILAANKAGN